MATDKETDAVVDILREEMLSSADPETAELADVPDDSDQDAEVEAEAAATETTDDEEPEEVFQAPEHWSSDEKEQFRSLSPEAQRILVEKDKQFQKGFQERAQSKSDLEAALEPWKQQIAQRGMSEADAIRTLFATQAQIEQDPVNGILMLAQRFGVLDQIQQNFAPDTDDDLDDPQIRALRNELRDVKSQLTNFQSMSESERQQHLQTEINNFKNAQDETGALKHPYFDNVRHLMAPLVQQGKSMDEAYNETVWSVPEYREQQLKVRNERKKEDDELAKARKVKDAKKAANSLKPSGKEDPASEDAELSLKDELSAAWKELA